MLNYILQVVLFQVLFLTIYDFFLSKETFFTKNRWYLLGTPILSFLIPLIKIPTFKKVVSKEVFIQLPEIVLSPEKVIQESNLYQSVNYLDAVFILGVLVSIGLFVYKLYQIIQLIVSCNIEKKSDFTLVLLPKETKAFSFFNYIFIGDSISKTQKDKIIQHELVHTQQKHSLDLLFFELLKIVMWFNPMIFIYQKRITLVHEYISDEVATKKIAKENYINSLLSSFFKVENISFINQFYKQPFIKKRIIMMTKKKSKKMNQLKYLLLIPALASMFFYTSCASKANLNIITEAEKVAQEKLKIKSSELESLVLVNKILKDSIDKLNEERNYHLKTESFLKDRIYKSLSSKYKEELSNENSVSFMKIDKAPTFPGCDSGDKDCFSKNIQKHFVQNFNSKKVNELGLSSGKKRVFIAFKIDKKGNIVDVQARAPHIDIEEEVIRVVNTLPKVIPGEQNGEKVSVKYTMPFVFFVE